MALAANSVFPDKHNILVVDDSEVHRDVLCKRLNAQGYKTQTAENGKVALEKLKQSQIDLVFLDIKMPVMDGTAALQVIKHDKALKSIPVIVLSANDKTESAALCLELGAEDYLTKPFNTTLMLAKVKQIIERKTWIDERDKFFAQIRTQKEQYDENLQKQIEQVKANQHAMIFAMSKLAESRDPDSAGHLERLRLYCQLLANHLQDMKPYQLQMPEHFIDTLSAASPLHDIGHIGIPEKILFKPGQLTDEERVIMQNHPILGGRALRQLGLSSSDPVVHMGIEITECHHERWDGNGYPHGLSKEDIPLSARILALADVYDALRSKRPYKNPCDHEYSKQIILQSAEKQFDPKIVDIFSEIHEEFNSIWEQHQ